MRWRLPHAHQVWQEVGRNRNSLVYLFVQVISSFIIRQCRQFDYWNHCADYDEIELELSMATRISPNRRRSRSSSAPTSPVLLGGPDNPRTKRAHPLGPGSASSPCKWEDVEMWRRGKRARRDISVSHLTNRPSIYLTWIFRLYLKISTVSLWTFWGTRFRSKTIAVQLRRLQFHPHHFSPLHLQNSIYSQSIRERRAAQIGHMPSPILHYHPLKTSILTPKLIWSDFAQMHFGNFAGALRKAGKG